MMNVDLQSAPPVLEARDLSVYYGKTCAVNSVSLNVGRNQVTAIIGPSGCGKSTFLRTLNRMNDFNPSVRTEGEVFCRGKNIYASGIDATEIRRSIGMVFQKPNPFPKSIAKNILWGLKINGMLNGNGDEVVERSLKQAGLWDEVKDRLNDSALNLSGGQQQRLCIARAIAMSPSVVLMDEPCSALDPRSTARIEDLINELATQYTIVIVTHNMQQAARVSKETAFFYEGKLVEFGSTQAIFTKPKNKKTEEYITGRMG